MAGCIEDLRKDPEHTVVEMLRQRLFGIIADYEDCFDHDDLRDDPLFQMWARKASGERPLASQPTLSRFENSITPRALQWLVDFQMTTGVERLKQHHHGQWPQALTLDIDPSDDPTHGQQQLALFHEYYEQHQYLPLMISEPMTKHMFLGWLRPGAVHAALGTEGNRSHPVGKEKHWCWWQVYGLAVISFESADLRDSTLYTKIIRFQEESGIDCSVPYCGVRGV